jgi:hypothetical protein
MDGNNYLPYLCRDDAVEEYRSLRNEIVESQKQRISLLQYFLIIIGALFGYLISDKEFSSGDALFLIVLTIAPSLFSYSTRCRERRIANYLEVYLGKLTPWSRLSSGDALKLTFWQRSSTTIIFFMILLDICLLSISCSNTFSTSFDFKSIQTEQVLWFIAIIPILVNILIAFSTTKLPTFKEYFEKERKNCKKKEKAKNE